MKLLWQNAGAELYAGDARRLDLIGDGTVSLVVTSPPYFDARPQYATWPSYADYLTDMQAAWAESYRVLRDGGRIAVNTCAGYGRPGSGGYRSLGCDTARSLEAAGFEIRGDIIWDKRPAERSSTAWGSWRSASNPSLRDAHEVVFLAHKGSARRAGPAMIDAERFLTLTSSIWTIAPARSLWHPAPFPAELAARLIELLSFPGSDVVLDPFAGTCTTVWAACHLGRRGIGVDLRADYLARAVAEHDAPLLRLAEQAGE